MKRIFLLLLSGMMITVIQAQDRQERYSVSGGLLGAVNLSKFNVSDDVSNVEYRSKTGWALGAWLNLPVGKAISIEPQLQYNTYSYLTDDTTSMLLNNGRIRYVSVPLLLKLHAGDKFAFTVGPQVDFAVNVKDFDNITTEEDVKKASFSLSGGIELFPRSVVTIFGRYVHGFSNMDNRPDHATRPELQNRNVQLGLKFRLFGKKTTTYEATAVTTLPDSDGDGITDDKDKCPNQFGLAKYEGCPIPDSDGDGINDELDKCPNVAGVAKYDGCPIPDSDGDGVNDEMDKCPNQAGPASNDGCPVSDRDSDGIPDAEDRCPDVAGIAANNGCPEVPANVSKSLGNAASRISFTGRTLTLRNTSTAALDEIVALMKEHPGLRIRVEGHTDNVGNEDDNEDLSSERAKAVKDYIVSKGIDESRVEKEGYGETMPIADNNTAAGRAKNNRIEIKIIY